MTSCPSLKYEDIGYQNETLVEIVLKMIAQKTELIRGYVRSKRYSLLDRKGIDFSIKLTRTKELPLQVKSSEKAARRFRGVGKSRGYEIPVIVVNRDDTLETLFERLTRLIQELAKKVTNIPRVMRTRKRPSGRINRAYVFRH